MKRRWNALLWLGFGTTVAAFLSYFLVFVYFPITRDVPWLNLLFFAVGVGLLAAGLRRAFREPTRYRGRVSGPVLATLSVLILGVFALYTFSFSKQLPESKAAPQVGEKAPDFTLPDQDGQPVTLSKLLEAPGEAQPAGPGRWVVLVFYRGYW